jgi:hypothetical protein
MGYYVLAAGATLLLLGVLRVMARFDVEDSDSEPGAR